MTTDTGPVPPAREGGPVAVPGNPDDADRSAASQIRLRLDISYDGTDFAGWAVQPGLRTVAGVLGESLALLFRGPVPLVVAGRTDSGVHATGQVAHIDVPVDGLVSLTPRHRRGPAGTGAGAATGSEAAAGAGEPPGDRQAGGVVGLYRRLAGLLPADLRVRRITVAANGFDARFSALRRHYRYRIGTAAWGVDPLDRVDVLARPRPLDAASMHRAAAALIGLQDFATYCKAREGATTIRELQRLSVTSAGDEVVVDVTADAFCHSMVRSLVGVLMAVGDGRMPIGEPAALLAAGKRTSAVHTAPARGLTLVGVDYPDDAELAARARATRAVRRPGG